VAVLATVPPPPPPPTPSVQSNIMKEQVALSLSLFQPTRALNTGSFSLLWMDELVAKKESPLTFSLHKIL
jgi:hypothetical protein